MNKKYLKLGVAALIVGAFLLPIASPARHESELQDSQNSEHMPRKARSHKAKRSQKTQQAPEVEVEKKDRTVLGSTLGLGALGAITAGAAGSGKWVPLGLVGGAIAGWAIGKAIEHKKKNKKEKRVVRNRKHKNSKGESNEA